MSNELFTGGNILTGFKKLANDAMMSNELKAGRGAYEINDAGGNSGYSYGPVQWDLLSGKETYKNAFKDILTNAKDITGIAIFSQNEVNSVYDSVINHQDISNNVNRINQALSSSYGQYVINTKYLDYLDTKITYIDKVIDTVSDPADKSFLRTDAGKLFLFDYDNQYDITWEGALHDFVRGLPSTINGNTTVQKQGVLDFGDLLTFYFNVQQFDNKPNDNVRRFGNLADIIDYKPQSIEEAQTILDIYRDKIAPRNGDINSSTLNVFKDTVLMSATSYISESSLSGPTTSDFNLNINPDLITPEFSTPTAPSESISSTNNTLISGGGYSVTGVGDVNVASQIDAWFNNSITANLSPGSFQTAQVSPVQSFAEMIAAPFSAPAISNAFNNYNFGLNFYTPTDPLILDLNGDGAHLTDYGSNPVLFDIDHDGGTLEQTGWVSPEDGMVVYDLNNNGKIDDISETLSEYFNGAVGTGGNAGEKKYANGLAALKSLDSNNDNQFTSADAAWANVKVWADANHDGKSYIDANNNGFFDAGETSELHTLDELGITAINLTQTSQSGLVRDGNEVLATSTFIQNGQTKEALAANFIANPNGSTFTASGSGTITQTEGNISSYSAADPASGTLGETIDVAQKAVNNALGGSGDDTLIGDAGNNWLSGGLGADSLSAGAGDDVLLIDANDTHIDGGDGNDLAQVVGDAGVTLNLAQSHIEGVQGGRGDDFIYGGGNRSVFVRGGDGNDVLIGGAANDVLNGENGSDLIDGGAGNDILRGGRGEDRIVGGAGDDLIYGGQDDDKLYGGLGNDILNGAQGDDLIDGGDGTDIVELSGSFADYRITQLNTSTWRVVDTKTGRDGADTLSHIEKLSFADVSGVNLSLDNPLPVKDVITLDNRIGVKLIKVADLLANDRDWQGDAIHLTTISDLQGGSIVGSYNATTKEWTPTLTAPSTGSGQAGEIQFIPDPNYRGVMSFKYKIADADNTPGATAFITGTSTQAEMRGQVYLKTPDMPTDTLFTDQWYLNDINVLPVWNDGSGQGYSGKGVNIAQFEPGMPFSTGAEIFDYRHPDLQANVDQSWIADPNGNLPQTFSNHATLVAGVMVAANNGEGAVGVAYNAKLSGHYIQGSGLEVSALAQEITDALATFKNYDVVNNSWGATDNFFINVTPVGTIEQGILDAVTQGRGGLGTAIVMAGGNDRQNGGNTNTNALSANRAVIVTGAINAQADISTLTIGQAPFSNPGASILISAPGSNIASTSRILMGDDGTAFGNDSSTVQGTSFATPIISGIVALMLEANPKLGWRDIQQILAISARKVDDPNTDTVWNTASNWNGGGMHTSHDYGFGDVDAKAAVRLAETWQGTHTSYNERHLSNSEGSMTGGANLGVAINDGTAITRTLSIGAGIRAEHVDISLDVTHSNWGDLTVELIAPSGTVSKLVSNPGTSATNAGGDVGSGQLTFAFDTTHSYGEDAQGNWQLKITDRSGLGAGTLNGWKVDVYGSDVNETINSRDNVAGNAPVISASADNQYYYTDEFAVAPGANRATLNDTNGGLDILNASAVSSNSTINLNNGATSTLAGRNLTINGDVEFAFGGDGNDTLTGNALSNRLQGGRGDDTLSGGAGTDLLDGGAGNNTLSGGSDSDFFVIRKNTGATDTITDFSPTTPGEKILLVGFDNITDFSQIGVTQEGVNTRLSLGNGQSMLLQNLAPSQISEQNFGFFSDNAMLDKYITYLSNSSITWGTSGIENMLLPNTMGDMRFFALGGNDVLGGQTKNDLIDGGDGNDTIWGDYPGYSPTPGQDWLEGGAGDDFLYGGADNDLLLGGSGNDVLNGEAGNDVLRGATGSDQLYGGDGNDVLMGGSGNDYLDGGAGDDVLTLEGDFGTVNGTAFSYYGTRVGGAGADVFKVLAGGGGNGGLVASGTQISAYNLIADFDPNQAGELIDLTDLKWIRGFADLSIQNMTINGTAFVRVIATDGTNQLAINLRGVNAGALNASHFKIATTPGLIFGGSGNDTLTGDAGGNTLNGGAGADAMTGRTGDDTYIVDNIGDTVNELPGGGYDTVQSSVTYTLPDNVENLTLTGTAAINGTGNNDANRIVGNSGNNVLDGKGGSDDLLGGAGDDIYVVDVGTDRITENANEGIDTVQSSASWTLGQNLENLTLTGTNSINATGNTLNNILTGNAGDNLLDGAEGADSMIGGAGDDTYFVDNSGDIITENVNEGIDTVYAAINTTLGANVENLILGIAATTGTGNELDNQIVGNALNNSLTGNAGNDWLDGGAGNDTLLGGLGDDTYIVDTAGDVATENAGEGTDTVLSGISYSLGANVENLTLTGTAANSGTGNALDNVLVGNTAANTLTGGAGNDWLDGAEGNDVMIGGIGNDTYIVDELGDVVTENANEGTDTVQSSIAYSLGNDVENLTLTGFSAINGTGNSLNNILTGNGADNILDGGVGADTLLGGAGNDTYVVDNIGDVVTENAGNGIDTVQSSIGYTLTDNVENLVLTGTANLDGSGNALNNSITGNSGNNVLDGGLGIDTMIGGAGNDTYIVDNTADAVIELAGAGMDSVFASANYTLSDNVENLALTGAASINATGNALDNILTGNGGANVLDGGAGADTLIGGQGNDTLLGGAGNDRYVFNSGDGADTVIDTLGSDILYIGGSVIEANLEAVRDGDNMIVNIFGTPDTITLTNWFVQTEGVNRIEFGNGSSLDRAGIEGLLNRPPVANADAITVYEDGGVVSVSTAALLANDTDPNVNDVISVVAVGASAMGASVSLANGQVQYDIGNRFQELGAGQTVTDSFGYTISDNKGATASSVVNVTITGVNDAAVTIADTAVVQEDLNITATGNVLSNDTDVDQGTVLSVADFGVFSGNYGNLTLAADGSYSYALDNASLAVQSLAAGQIVTETFGYQATDGLIATPSTLTVTITGTNDTPVTTVDTAAVQEDLNITATGNVLSNDIDVDQGSVLSVTDFGVFAGSYGSLTLLADGSYTYALDNASQAVQSLAAGQIVTETFGYQATDGLTNTPSTLTVTITGTNDAPVTTVDTAAVQEDLGIPVTGNVLSNDTDMDQGTVLSVADFGIRTGSYGSLTLLADGSYTYALDNASLAVQSLAAGQTVTETFGYQATDGLIATPSTLTVTITGTNDAPVTIVDTAVVQEDLSITTTGNVLSNDTDVDQGTVLSVADFGIRTGSYGSLTLLADGSYSYALDNASLAVQSLAAGQIVTETFGYQATDGLTNTPSTLTVTITGTNDAPVVATDLVAQGATQGQLFTYSIPTNSFTDVDSVNGDSLTYTATLADGSALPSWLSFNAAAGTFSGTPGMGDLANLNIMVTATDTGNLSANSNFILAISAPVFNGTAGNDNLVGTVYDDTLYGLAGNDVLDGVTGADTMEGGAGDDTYVVDNTGDVVTENANEGTDTVQSSISYALGENVENLTLTGTDSIDGTGNVLNNILTGNAAANVLDGRAGADTLVGGQGDDTYIVDNADDNVVENAGEGTETVQSSLSYTLGANVENLVLVGVDSIDGTGNTLDNTLIGNSSNNLLNGGAGADIMMGGVGDDTYVVDNLGDTITENLDEGIDTVQSSLVSYVLSANVENLILTGVSAIAGTGNSLDNILIGNGGTNVLDGGRGADTMAGGTGNDLYLVDNSGDVVNENANEGIDTIQSSISYTLNNNVENLALAGKYAITGIGNELDNVLKGSSAANILIGEGGNDTLNGGSGADQLLGGLGNDTYVVDNIGDVIIENLDEGNDTVQSSVSYTLAANVENLTLTGGVYAINGTGNSLDNTLIGNSGNNVLSGDAGNDILQGGNGNDTLNDTAGANLLDGGMGVDTLTGGAGNELFAGGAGNDIINTGNGADVVVFNRNDGQDILNGGVGTDNTLSLGGGIQYSDLALSKSGNDLILEVGDTDQVTLTGWYDTIANHKSVLNLQVVADAIAGFDRASNDPLLNKSIQNFDFTAIVNAFDQANGGSANFMHWSATDSLLTAHLSASDSEALGGDLANQYGKNGNFNGFSQTAAQDVLSNPSFGTNPQLLHDLSGLGEGIARLS